MYDILIVGAGISGINAAYRLQKELPWASYTILEARGGIGGTWDLFRYPGFRSDSDLQTFGFEWRPWTEKKVIADGQSILTYIRESAAAHGIGKKIQYHHKVVSGNWSSHQQAWTLRVEAGEDIRHVRARYVILGTGYYDYDEALSSSIPGKENFKGTILHPQFWPKDYDYKDKKIVVIGSGSTAVTLIPSLAERAAHVTMLQRSPSYLIALPATDTFGEWASKLLPPKLAYRLTRLEFLILGFFFVKFCALYPLAAKRLLKKETIKQLPETIPHDPNFQPRYNPWEQRMCICPEGDFFKALRSGKASVVTDTISSVTETGIQLASGQNLDADVIVTATGLKIKVAGGATFSVNGIPVIIGEKFLWQGVMLQDVPNLATVIGYTNASWTPGADATALLICRHLKYMQSRGFAVATPRVDDSERMKAVPALNITSTYVVRGEKELPKTGNKAPWLPRSSYFADLWTAAYGDLTQGLQFEKASVS